jgi:hypothetical protein
MHRCTKKVIEKDFQNYEGYRKSRLPSYLEREGSSLIYMVKDLIQLSTHPESGFYLHNHDELIKNLIRLMNQDKM